MRVADLDTRDYTAKCAIDLILDRSPIRTCRTMNSGSAICSSDIFTVSDVSYSKVWEESEPTRWVLLIHLEITK